MSRVNFPILIIFILCISCTIRAQETTPEPPPATSKKPEFGFSIFENSDDAVFSFIKNLLSTGHAGTQLALNRLKNEAEKRKQFLDEIRTSLLPSSSQS